jgi:hypothetical protein
VPPRNVVCLGGAADQVGGGALLFFACELDRGLFGELVVGDPLLSESLSRKAGEGVGERFGLRVDPAPGTGTDQLEVTGPRLSAERP